MRAPSAPLAGLLLLVLVVASALAAVVGPSVLPASSGPHTAGPADDAWNALLGTTRASAGIAWRPSDGNVSDPFPQGRTGYTEISAAVSPVDPQRMVVASMDYSRPSTLTPGFPDPSVRFWSSRDGGATWIDHGLAPAVGNANGVPLTCADWFEADPSAVFDKDGVAYLAYLSYGCPERKVIAVLVSTDGGETWSAPRVAMVAGAERLPGLCDSMDKEWLAADPLRGGVVMTWTAFLSDCHGNTVGWPIVAARTDDQARSWSAASLVAAEPSRQNAGPSVRVAPDGTAFVSYLETVYATTSCPFLQVTTDQTPRTERLMVARSSDGGASWMRADAGPICPLDYLTVEHPFPGGAEFTLTSIAVDDASGAIFVTWADRAPPSAATPAVVLATGEAATPQAVVVRSTDGGASWARVKEAGAPGFAALLPQVVATQGNVVLLYLREHATGLYDAAVDVSTDGGESWAPTLQLSTAPQCSCYFQVKSNVRAGGMMGHYLGLDAHAGRVLAAWVDNRDVTTPQGVFARVGDVS